jgi:hypothetical protein
MVAESGEEVDSGHSSEDSSDEDHVEPTAEDDRTEDPETNDESFTSGYVEDSVQPRATTQGDSPGDITANLVPAEDGGSGDNQAEETRAQFQPAGERTTLSENEIVAKVITSARDGTARTEKTGTNPFDEDEEDDEDKAEDTVDKRESSLSIPTDEVQDVPCETEVSIRISGGDFTKDKVSESGNPFGSDCDSDNEDQRSKTLLATKTSHEHQLEDQQKQQSKSLSSSLNPFGSDLSSDEDGSRGSVSPSPSTRSGTRLRKKRRAPLPPRSQSGTPKNEIVVTVTDPLSRPVAAPRPSLAAQGRYSAPTPSEASAEAAKRLKDENNMNRRSQILESIRGEQAAARPEPPSYMMRSDTSLSSTQADSAVSSSSQSETVSLMSVSTTTTQSSRLFSPLPADKSDEGQWRKKKGPAPPRPIPPRRTVKKLHRKVINQELEDIEVKQNELERQGVKLEKTIREICDKNDAEEGADRDSLGPEAEDLIIQLFDLVNEKNELFRRQTELIYMKKENRLEEQHADLEYQIRVLMAKPEAQRTEEDRAREEKLIARLVQVVGLRNEIVDCLEMDRLR